MNTRINKFLGARNIRSLGNLRRAWPALFGLLLLPVALVVSGSGSSGLELEHEYFLPLYFDADTEIEVDTEYCEDPYLTGEGWAHGWLHTDSAGDIELIGGIPPWSRTLGSFTFCGDDLVPWDEGVYKVSLSEYEELSGGNKLRLVFDVPQTEDDLVVILWRTTPKFEVIWDGTTYNGVALPFSGKPFQWTIE